VALLDRYLLREIGTSFAAVAAALTSIFLAYSLTRFLTDAASGLLDAGEVARLTLFKSIIALEVLLPLALYFGLIVGFARLNAHNELTAMHACGYGQRRLWRALAAVSTLLALAVGTFSLHVRPWAYDAMFRLKALADASSELDRLKPRRFYLYDSNQRAVYIETIAHGGRRLGGVFIRERHGDSITVLSAPDANLDAFVSPTRHRLELNAASIYKSVDAGSDFYGNFASLTLSVKAARALTHEYKTKAATSLALWRSDADDDRAELQWRLSTAVSTLLLALAALLFAETRPRQALFARFPFALVVYAVYYNLLGVARTWVEHGIAATIWWVPALLALGVTLYARRQLGATPRPPSPAPSS